MLRLNGGKCDIFASLAAPTTSHSLSYLKNCSVQTPIIRSHSLPYIRNCSVQTPIIRSAQLPLPGRDARHVQQRLFSKGSLSSQRSSRNGVKYTGTFRKHAIYASQNVREAIYTHLGSNSWKIELPASGLTVLTDPWLIDNLTFFDQDWLYEGIKRKDVGDVGLAFADGCDAILITQGLDDHAHRPTLKRLPKHLWIIASPTGAEVTRDLGFTNVTSLAPGCGTTLDGKLDIQATSGALVGPPWSQRENGFILRERSVDGISLYYEPHCSFDYRSLEQQEPVDLVISPAASVSLGAFPLVNGVEETVKLLNLLQPQVMMPLPNAEIEEDGVLAPWISSSGTPEATQQALNRANISTTVRDIPQTGQGQRIQFS
ncbi:hypothetical protein CYMTET_37835 [Cymbomonas tetramitiformis]|uniref:Metallo-beta-lactamase domain-containing protein n=1 Tax=Cymbomonas tetramitiformis TaxID=36881 RepID=A0AAE0CEN0_9CHLO|nr:hypothetical protein CYMTET_37835 [Cymbomonas tetramitiformis]